MPFSPIALTKDAGLIATAKLETKFHTLMATVTVLVGPFHSSFINPTNMLHNHQNW